MSVNVLLKSKMIAYNVVDTVVDHRHVHKATTGNSATSFFATCPSFYHCFASVFHRHVHKAATGNNATHR